MSNITVVIGGHARDVLDDCLPSPAIVVDTDSRSTHPAAFANHCEDEISGGGFWSVRTDPILSSIRRALTKSTTHIVLVHSTGGGTGSGGSVAIARALRTIEWSSSMQIFSISISPHKGGQIRPMENENTSKCLTELRPVVDTIVEATSESVKYILHIIANNLRSLEKIDFARCCLYFPPRELQQRMRKIAVGTVFRFAEYPDGFLTVPASVELFDVKMKGSSVIFLVIEFGG
jgi:hypothetical protein